MKRHWLAVAAVTAVVLTAAAISPGHALLLAIGLAAGPTLMRALRPQAEGAPPGASVLSSALPAIANPFAILDGIAVPVLVLNRRAQVLHENQAARAAFPTITRDAPLSFALRDPVLLTAVGDAIAERAPRFVELTERVPVERSFACTISPLQSEARDNAPVAVLIFRETSRERAVEAMRVDFVANASHELRTPLATIQGFIETLQGAAKNDAAARETFLAVMHTQAQRMARLVDDLLSLSRIELKEHIPPSDRVDVAAVAGDAVLALSEVARERGVAIALDVQTTDANVAGDRDELASVFDNLIENAIKYGKSGGKVDVVVSGTADDPMLTIAVRDYGAGIAPHFLPRLTERFYRVDSAQSRAEGGTGLGLALVKHTINRHRGRLNIHSTLGAGTTVIVTLPRVATWVVPGLTPAS